MVEGARGKDASALAGVIGVGTLLFAASGTFGAMQSALNAVWKFETPDEGGISGLVRAKLAAIGLVAATVFLLLALLVASAGIAAFGSWVTSRLSGGELLLHAVEIAVSLVLLTALFAAVYKVLPDHRMAWRDVLVGAFATAVLFTVGKTAIGLYLGHAAIGSAYGAAGSLVVVLVWVYYSSLIFLLGADFTRAWAGLEGSRQAAPVPADAGPRTAVLPRADPPRPRAEGILVLAATLMVAARAWRSLCGAFPAGAATVGAASPNPAPTQVFRAPTAAAASQALARSTSPERGAGAIRHGGGRRSQKPLSWSRPSARMPLTLHGFPGLRQALASPWGNLPGRPGNRASARAGE